MGLCRQGRYTEGAPESERGGRRRSVVAPGASPARAHKPGGRKGYIIFGVVGAFLGAGLVACLAAAFSTLWGGPPGRMLLPVGIAGVFSGGLGVLLIFLAVRARRRAGFGGECGCEPVIISGGPILCYRLSDEAYGELRSRLNPKTYELTRAADLGEAGRVLRSRAHSGCVIGEWLPGDEWLELRHKLVSLPGSTKAIFFVGDEGEIKAREGSYEGAKLFAPAARPEEVVWWVILKTPAYSIAVPQ